RLARPRQASPAPSAGDALAPPPPGRRAPPRTRRWAAPLLAGAIGAAAAATLVLLLRPSPAPETIARERFAARDFASAPSAVPPELLTPKQKGVETFAKSGAPAADEAVPGSPPRPPLALAPAADLHMAEPR